MLKFMLTALLSFLMMVFAGLSAATPYDRFSDKLHLLNIWSEAISDGSLQFLSAAATDKSGTTIHIQFAEPVSGNDDTIIKWDRNFTSLLNGRVPNDEFEKAFTRVTASIITPSGAKHGITPANWMELREITHLMSSATAKLQVLDSKMAKFNFASQAGNPTPPANQKGGGAAAKLRIVPQGSELAGAATLLFRNVKLFIAGNLKTFLPVGATVMVFVFFLFRRIEKYT